jgi:hypothetical protein
MIKNFYLESFIERRTRQTPNHVFIKSWTIFYIFHLNWFDVARAVTSLIILGMFVGIFDYLTVAQLDRNVLQTSYKQLGIFPMQTLPDLSSSYSPEGPAELEFYASWNWVTYK